MDATVLGVAIDSGATAWVLVSAALVLLMTPGLGFFYGGLGKEKNLLNTLAMSMGAMGAVAIAWALVGYSLAFAQGNSFVGGLSHLGLRGVGMEPREGTTIPEMAFMTFQMMFALVTPALISGSIVGRVRFPAYVTFILLWSLTVYAPLAHWVWGGGFLAKLGALDFAGGTVVHISAGVAALVAAAVVGPRAGGRRFGERPHNVPFVLLGVALLWFGWCGFNGGSALAADGIAALALTNTTLAGAAAMVSWALLESSREGKPSATGGATGAVVGLVAITPAAGYVTPLSAVAIGALGAIAAYFTAKALARTRLDDSHDVFACHGVGGVVGSLATGLFASAKVNPSGADGLLAGNSSLLLKQLIGIACAALLSAAMTALIMLILKPFLTLRSTESAESTGLDLSEHGERPYGALGEGFGSMSASEARVYSSVEDQNQV